ncbi:MAG: cobaltochelatase subunit CobN [Hyphomicrobiales bacterium]|nr:cobaltochelatase subunit CobN [Hyphomicrobiales bacterium]
MHMRLFQKGKIDFGAPNREEHQPTADIVFISAHDSELRLLAECHRDIGADAPSLTLTNYLTLTNPSAIAPYIEETLRGARLVVLRQIGGESYWPEGVDALREWAFAKPGRQLALVPGGTVWDEQYAARGTAGLEKTRSLWRYLSEGGARNVRNGLHFMASLLDGREEVPPPEPMPLAGFVASEDACPADAALIIYRALAQAGDLEPADALREALRQQGLRLSILYVSSLKDPVARDVVASALKVVAPSVVINATAFAADTAALFRETPVLQTAFAGQSRREWAASQRGMGPSDLAMHVVMPELDGRIFTSPVAFKTKIAWDAEAHHVPTVLQAEPSQVAALAARAAALVKLQRTKPGERRLAIILANYPNRDGRLANGVGLDTPQSCADLVAALEANGYLTGDAPRTSAGLMALLAAGPTNAADKTAPASVAWPLEAYRRAFAALPADLRQQARDQWGEPEADPHAVGGAIQLALHRFGNLVLCIQPSRGYDVDPAATFHDPALVPPHRYIATYLWLRTEFQAHAFIHLGKHGNLEWLPGKAVGLSQACWPAALIGPLPNIYPFIVNDPGEGVQAKRRISAVIIDHLTPPLTRGELHGDLAQLETLVDEHALATDLDPRRARRLADEIAGYASVLRLDEDIGLNAAMPIEEQVRRVDAHLCDLKEMQIRDGLHVIGSSPQGRLRTDLAVSIARVPRPGEAPAARSLHRAIAADLGLGDFDPLTRDLSAAWTGPRPHALIRLSADPWRSVGDTVERVELLAQQLVGETRNCPSEWARTSAVLAWIRSTLLPAVDACGAAETAAILAALDGRHVAPGPSGAPSRGRPDVLPTGRNFYAVDPRAVPTPSAFAIGKASAEALVKRHWDETGSWLRSVAFSAWGTANMRTGGDDVAQALALLGCRPVWEPASGRVTGFEILPASEMRRPRVDVTFRVSGLFRDAFPTQMDLIDSAVKAVAALDEDAHQNPVAAAVRREVKALRKAGHDLPSATRLASARVFGAMPGAYGAGLQAPIDSGAWTGRADLSELYLAWSGFAYGGGQDGRADREALERRLRAADAVLQAQDNREHDLLDSDDYYQFMGGLAASIETLSGRPVPIYHTDTSRPEDPKVRTLAEEIARVVRGRAANPKWIAGIMRHGYKGAFEMAATLDYLFAFAATTHAVKSHHFDQLFDAYLADNAVRTFIREHNPDALREMALRFEEAIRRGFWQPRSNGARAILAELSGSAAAVAGPAS